MTLPHESTVNVNLGNLLAEKMRSAEVISEERVHRAGKSRQFDVKIIFREIEFVLEASYDAADAEEDAQKRLREGLIDTVSIAIHYDPVIFEGKQTSQDIINILFNKSLKLKVYTQGVNISGSTLSEFMSKSGRGEPIEHGGWIYTKLDDFSSFLESIIELIVEENVIEDLINSIEEKVNNFINLASTELERTGSKENIILELNKMLFSPSNEENEEIVKAEVPEEVILSHTYISLLIASILYDSVCLEHQLKSLKRLLRKNQNHPLLAMQEAFEDILEVNYENVFAVSLGLLDILYDLSSIQRIMDSFSDMINHVAKIVRNKALLRQDFIGQIYHKITGDIAVRKGYATYYTKAPIATFLSNMALNLPNDNWDIDWGNIEKMKFFRVCDFACGSGTLISAVYSTLLSKYEKSLGDRDLDFSELHSTLLEKSIWSFDALEQAVQTASVVLSLHEPGVPLNKINVYHIPIDESGALGSLSLYLTNQAFISLNRRSVDKITSGYVSVPKFDFIIMNPPFSRSTAPGNEGSRPRIFDFVVEEDVYEKLWDDYKNLIKEIKKDFKRKEKNKMLFDTYVGQGKVFLKKNINPLNAGAALPFIFLADKYLRLEGRLALVLPKTVIESSTFFILRLGLLNVYEIEYIISSEESGNNNFSHSTSLSEVLLILKKVGKDKTPENETRILRFKKQPKKNLEGLLLSKNVLNNPNETSYNVLNSEAEAYSIDRNMIEHFVWNWAMLTTLPPNLVPFIENLLNGKILDNNFIIKDYFDLENQLSLNYVTRYKGGAKKLSAKFDIVSNINEFWFLDEASADVFSKSCLTADKVRYLYPKDSNALNYYKNHSGRLLIPEAFRFNTSGRVSIWSEHGIFSTRVHSITSEADKNEKVEKALCTWLNSTFILIYLRALSTTVEGNFGHIYGWHLKTIPFPDLTDDEILDELDKVFEKYQDCEWEPLPIQYEKSISGENEERLKFDLEILKAISKDLELEKAKQGLLNIYLEFLKILKDQT